MRCVFVTDFLFKGKQGGQMLANAHYNTLKKICGENNVFVCGFGRNFDSKKTDNILRLEMDDSFLGKINNIAKGRPFFCSEESFLNIKNFIDKVKPEFIFVDNCCLGEITKWCMDNYPDIPRIVFCHGVYANSERQIINRKKLLKKVKYYPIFRNLLSNEKKSIISASAYIVLNDRDNQMLERYYGCKADYLLPMYFADSAKITEVDTNTDHFNMLFLGSYFWPNIEGLCWFAKEVMPCLDERITLSIVGRGMEELKQYECMNKYNISIIGEIDNLEDAYNTADIVIGPIFSGDGMKTKTAEAMMYGKIYLGTAEALCGYCGLDKYHCETAQEFIEMINNFAIKGVNKYNPQIRNIFLEKYSDKMAENIISEILCNMGVTNDNK